MIDLGQVLDLALSSETATASIALLWLWHTHKLWAKDREVWYEERKELTKRIEAFTTAINDALRAMDRE